jgi:hypothetical protein
MKKYGCTKVWQSGYNNWDEHSGDKVYTQRSATLVMHSSQVCGRTGTKFKP